MTTQLTPNFTLEEFEREGVAVPASYTGNAMQVAQLLESARAAGGNLPITVTSGYRTALGNTLAGGASDSQHLTASAADFTVPTPIIPWSVQVLGSGALLPFGQWIIYPWSDQHIHLSLPGSHVGQLLCEVGVNQYAAWDGTAENVPVWGASALTPATADAPGGEGSGFDLETALGLVLATGVIIYGLS